MADPPMDVMRVVLDGSEGVMTLTPLTEQQWWALKARDRPGLYHYHPQLKVFFVISFEDGAGTGSIPGEPGPTTR